MSEHKPIALTGGSGLLGSALQHVLKEAGRDAVALPWDAALDQSPLELAVKLKQLRVSHLVHCAANTNVEQCEKTPDLTFRDNLLVSEVWATACAEANVRLVFISSTGIYAPNSDSPSCEFDTPQPKTVHHRSKYLAECSVQTLCPGTLVIRTGWLFGGALAGKSDFVTGRLREAQNVDVILSNTEQRGNPTYTLDVGRKIMQLIDAGHSGVFNCVNQGGASRYDYVKAVLDNAGLEIPVEARPAEHFARVAPVSPNETADNWKLAQIGLNDLDDWQTALARYMAEFGVS